MAPPFGHNPPSVAIFAFRFLLRKNLGNLFTPASLPVLALDFAAGKIHLSACGGEP
jgi:hypothetical protein